VRWVFKFENILDILMKVCMVKEEDISSFAESLCQERNYPKCLGHRVVSK